MIDRRLPDLVRYAMESQHLRAVIARFAPNPFAPAMARNRLNPILATWANRYLRGIAPSGSFAKGTAVSLSHDVDLFVSVAHDVPESLEEIYESLFSRLQQEGLSPSRQNVSVGLKLQHASVDVVPARRLPGAILDHAVYRSKTRKWTKTNVHKHIRLVKVSGRIAEIKAMKIWRSQFGIEFPSFYLELAVLRALGGAPLGQIGRNFRRVLEYLATEFQTDTFTDPANSCNVISDDLTADEQPRCCLGSSVVLVS